MDSVSLVHLTATTIDRLAYAIIMGTAVVALWFVPAKRYLQGVGALVVAIAIVVIAAMLELLARSAVMADVGLLDAIEFLPMVLAKSEYGSYWVWRMVMAASFCFACIWIWRKAWCAVPVYMLSAVAVFSLMLVSVTTHAGEAGLWSAVNLVNSLHLVAGLVWGGAVLVSVLLLFPSLHRSNDSGALIKSADQLSSIAMVALVLVTVSGVFNTWQQLRSISDIWLTDYGIILGVKLFLVMLMMTIGALNRFYLIPKMAAWHHSQAQQWGSPMVQFVNVLRIDSWVFIAIVCAAVYLGMQEPPKHMM